MIKSIDTADGGFPSHIMFTKAKLRKFRQAFARAMIEHNNDTDAVFEFEHKEFVIAYAAYMIEYLEGRFK